MVEHATLGRQRALRGIRAFNPARDLGALANLIEVSFAEDLSAAGRSTVDEIRSLQWMGPFIRAIGLTSGLFRDLFAGYVWIEKGEMVGNVTVSRSQNHPSEWIISNLAVYPEYRRRGIARHLMESAIEHALERDAEWISLQVRSDNTAAKTLYHKFGFHILDTFSEMHAKRLRSPASLPDTDYEIISPDTRRRQAIYSLEKEATSQFLQEMHPLYPEESQRCWAPGWVTRLGELLQGGWSRRKWILQEGDLVAAVHLVLNWGGDSHRATFLIHPHYRGKVEELLTAVLCHLARLATRRYTVTNIPTTYPRLIEDLEKVGFRQIRVLDVMGLPLQH